MIPKIIHYCWFGKNPIDEKSKNCIESWKKYCPEYQIIEWNEDNFDLKENIYAKEAYDAKKWAFVTDYVRLYVLYHYGGIYMDTDVELLKNLDEFLKCTAFSGFESEKHIPTAIMGSEAGGEWIKYLLKYYEKKHFILENKSLDLTTNVVTITNMTKQKYQVKLNNTYQIIKNEKGKNCLILYPKEYFCPKSYQTGEIVKTNNTVCIHHFNASWHSEYEKIGRQKRENYIKRYGRKKGEKMYYVWFIYDRAKRKLKQEGIKGLIEGIIKGVLDGL